MLLNKNLDISLLLFVKGSNLFIYSLLRCIHLHCDENKQQKTFLQYTFNTHFYWQYVNEIEWKSTLNGTNQQLLSSITQTLQGSTFPFFILCETSALEISLIKFQVLAHTPGEAIHSWPL